MILVVAQEKQRGDNRFLWSVYAWAGKGKTGPLQCKKRSKLCGDITAFAVGRMGQQFYLNGFNKPAVIVQADKAGKEEKQLFRHTDYVRDLALDEDDNVYFSSARGTEGDGHIYRVRPANKDRPATAELFCVVRVRDLAEKGWTGYFAFGRDAQGRLDTNTLYLSTNLALRGSVGSIYRRTRKGGEWSKPERVFTFKEPIHGLVFTSRGEAYFASTQNWSTDPAAARNITLHVYRLTELKRAEPVLKLDVDKIWNVSLVRGETTLPRGILAPVIQKKK